MKTYIYESIPAKCCEEPKHYEIEQEADAAPLTTHPQTGEAIRRVLIDGKELTGDGGCCCGESGCC